MSFAPRHDYEIFERATAPSRLELARQACATEKFDRYSELLAVANPEDKPRLTIANARRRWLGEKLELRLKLLFILGKADDKLE